MTSNEKRLFEQLGGVEKNNVSNDLDYLVLKDINSSSSKAEKARKLGINIISMEELRKLLS